jgi:oligoribonuclease
VLNHLRTKQGTHRALDDIRESVIELRHYREKVFVPMAPKPDTAAAPAPAEPA